MARGRMLNQTISMDKAVNDLPDDTARLLFTWCIPYLDREGRMPGNPTLVCNLVFTRRADISVEQVAGYLAAMHALGLAIWYESGGDLFLFFPGFDKNQQGLRRDREAESRCPPPPETPGAPPAWPRDDGGLTPELVRSSSGVAPDLVQSNSGVTPHDRADELPQTDDSNGGVTPAQIKGKESQGKRKKDSSAAAAPPPGPEEHPPPDSGSAPEEKPETDHQKTMRLFDEALKAVNPRNSIKDGGASGKAVKSMLARGYTPEQIIQVWRELKARPFFERQYLSMVTVDKQIDDMLRGGLQGGTGNGGHGTHQSRGISPELGEQIRAAHRKARASAE